MSYYKLVAAIVGIAVFTVLGDYFIKLASMENKAILNRWFIAGCATYILCTIGWVFIMPHMKLASIGVVYSLSIIVLMAILGACFFGEALKRHEIVGMGFAVAAIILLGRFGG